MASLFFSFLVSASFLSPQPHNSPKLPLYFHPDWTAGVVVLESNDTVTCQLRYNQIVPEGLLQVLDGENTLTLSVKDVKCFFFFDARMNRYRKFFTLSVPLSGNRGRETFLEYVYGNDNVSILNHKTMGLAHDYMEFAPFSQPVPINNLYLLDVANNRLLPLSEKNALSLLENRGKVGQYIRENHLRFRRLSDYVKAFEYDQRL